MCIKHCTQKSRKKEKKGKKKKKEDVCTYVHITTVKKSSTYYNMYTYLYVHVHVPT